MLNVHEKKKTKIIVDILKNLILKQNQSSDLKSF